MSDGLLVRLLLLSRSGKDKQRGERRIQRRVPAAGERRCCGTASERLTSTRVAGTSRCHQLFVRARTTQYTMYKDRTWADLTDAEIEKAAKLTAKEQAAVDAFVAAAKALPRSLSVGISDYDDRDDGLTISKRITPGFTQVVANVRKRSLLG